MNHGTSVCGSAPVRVGDKPQICRGQTRLLPPPPMLWPAWAIPESRPGLGPPISYSLLGNYRDKHTARVTLSFSSRALHPRQVFPFFQHPLDLLMPCSGVCLGVHHSSQQLSFFPASTLFDFIRVCRQLLRNGVDPPIFEPY
jgi:hypothetical protein